MRIVIASSEQRGRTGSVLAHQNESLLSTLLDMTLHMEAHWPFLEHLLRHAID
jgi:hypothetical protein